MPEEKEVTRIRIAYKISAKGQFCPDVTGEAETVETAINLIEDGLARVKDLARKEGAEIV